MRQLNSCVHLLHHRQRPFMIPIIIYNSISFLSAMMIHCPQFSGSPYRQCLIQALRVTENIWEERFSIMNVKARLQITS